MLASVSGTPPPWKSLMEGLDETLTLPRLGVFHELGISLKATNLIESMMMARVEEKTARVDRWRTSEQKQRWCEGAILEQCGFRRIKGYQHLQLPARALTTGHIEITEGHFTKCS